MAAWVPHLEGLRLLFLFYFKHLSTVRSLPVWLRNPDIFDAHVAAEAKKKSRARTAGDTATGKGTQGTKVQRGPDAKLDARHRSTATLTSTSATSTPATSTSVTTPAMDAIVLTAPNAPRLAYERDLEELKASATRVACAHTNDHTSAHTHARAHMNTRTARSDSLGILLWLVRCPSTRVGDSAGPRWHARALIATHATANLLNCHG